MTVLGKRPLTIAAATALALTLGAVGLSYADNVFDAGLLAAGDGDAITSASTGDDTPNADNDDMGPEVDLFSDGEEADVTKVEIRLKKYVVKRDLRYKGNTDERLVLHIDDVDATDEQRGETTWASSDESVVRVDADGTPHYTGVGTATVTATYHGVQGSCELEVKEPTLAYAYADGHTVYTDEFGFGREDGLVIKLLTDVAVEQSKALGLSMSTSNIHETIDLNRHKLRLSNDRGRECIEIKYHNTLTVKNGMVEINPTSEHAESGFYVESGELVIAPDCYVNAFGDVCAVRVGGKDRPKLTCSGILTAQCAPIIKTVETPTSRPKAYESTAEVDIKFGMMAGGITAAIESNVDGTVSIADCTIDGTGGVIMNKGELFVENTQIDGDDRPGILVAAPATATISSDARISGQPSIQVKNPQAYAGTTAVTIEGGKFSDDAVTGEGFALPEGKELVRDEARGWFVLQDIKKDDPEPQTDRDKHAKAYDTLLEHYADKMGGKEVDTTGDEALKEQVASIEVPASEAPKANGGSNLIKLTSASLTFGDTATVNFCFTPADGHTAADIETTLDGVIVRDGEKLAHEATKGTVERRVLSDGRLCLSISGISVEHFAHRFDVKAGGGTTVKQLDYSVLSYLYLNQQVEGVGDICKALYGYYLATLAN